MAESARFPGRHPLCTCPEISWTNLVEDRRECKGGTVAHPVLTADDIREIIKGYQNAR